MPLTTVGNWIKIYYMVSQTILAKMVTDLNDHNYSILNSLPVLLWTCGVWCRSSWHRTDRRPTGPQLMQGTLSWQARGLDSLSSIRLNYWSHNIWSHLWLGMKHLHRLSLNIKVRKKIVIENIIPGVETEQHQIRWGTHRETSSCQRLASQGWRWHRSSQGSGVG